MRKFFLVLLFFFLVNSINLSSSLARNYFLVSESGDKHRNTSVPAEYELLISQAKKEALSGNYEISLKYILKTLDKSVEIKHFKETENLINYIFNSTENPDYLNSYYDKLAKLASNNTSSPAFDILIKSYEEIKNYEGIINLYRLKLLTNNHLLSDQEKSSIFEKMGDVYDLLKQQPLNTDNYKRALEFNEKNLSAREKLAYNLLLTGDIRNAEKHYKKLLELNSDNDKAHLGLGIIIYIKGDAKNAAEEFKLVKNKDKNTDLLELIVKYELSKGTISNLFRYWGL